MLKKRLFGNKKKFAIQFEVTSTFNQFIYGKICYWIQEKQLGKYEEGATISDVLLFLPSIIQDNGNRKHERFFIMDMDELVHLLSGAAFLEDNVKIEETANEEQWARFNICMPMDVFYDIDIFLIDSHEKSRIVFSYDQKNFEQIYIEKGYVDKVFLQLYNELNLLYDEEE